MSPAEISSLVDRISSALGPEARLHDVERIARAVIGDAERNPSPAPPSVRAVGDGPISGRIIVTAFGCDRPGILAAVTGELFHLGVNVLDVSQKILQEYFTLILLADLSDAGTTPHSIQERLQQHADRLDVRIIVQHEEMFEAMNRV